MTHDENREYMQKMFLFLQDYIKHEISLQKRRVFSIMIAAMAVSFGIFGFSIKATSERMVAELLTSSSIREITKFTDATKTRLEDIEDKLNTIETLDSTKIADLVKKLEEISEQSDSTQFQEVLAKVTANTAEISVIKDQQESSNLLLEAMGQDSAKALAIPILRKELDSLKDRFSTQSKTLSDDISKFRATVTAETSRIYDLGKWFLGMILAVSIVPIIEPLFKRKKMPESQIPDRLNMQTDQSGGVTVGSPTVTGDTSASDQLEKKVHNPNLENTPAQDEP